jgi:hypothetical protein
LRAIATPKAIQESVDSNVLGEKARSREGEMIGFRRDAQEFISPMSREECLQKLEGAFNAPFDRGFAALTADLAEENGKTKISCEFSIHRILAFGAILLLFAMAIGEGIVFLVSLIELMRGSPFSIQHPGWVRFLGLPVTLGFLVIVVRDAPGFAVADRKLLVNFLWKTLRATPMQLPPEIRDGFEV